MLQFFTKLRRHASLEGASPYFKIKKWKLDSSQRASSLDTRGNDPHDPERIKLDPQSIWKFVIVKGRKSSHTFSNFGPFFPHLARSM